MFTGNNFMRMVIQKYVGEYPAQDYFLFFFFSFFKSFIQN